MKNILCFLSVLVFFVSCKKEKDIGVFEGVPGPNDGDTTIHNTNNYRLTKILNFSKSDSEEPYNYVEFTYDSRGNLTRESLIDYPDLLATYKTYTYENGRVTRQQVYDGLVNALTLSTTITYTYQDNLLLKEQAVRSDGSLIHSTHYVYSGRRLTETYKMSESLGKHHDYRNFYDARGNMVRQEAYMYNNELEWTEKYEYDALNRRIKTERINHLNLLESVIKMEYSGNFTLPAREIYFDAAGNETQSRTYSMDIFGNQVQANIGANILNKRKYFGSLLREEIRYSPQFGFVEFGMTRYEYQKK